MANVPGFKGDNMAKQPKTLTERLPDRPKTVLIQADLDANLHARVKSKIDKLKATKLITWKSLIELALEKWLEET